jgi:hypothetical protein
MRQSATKRAEGQNIRVAVHVRGSSMASVAPDDDGAVLRIEPAE